MQWSAKWTQDDYLQINIPVQALSIQVFLQIIQEEDIKKCKKYECSLFMMDTVSSVIYAVKYIPHIRSWKNIQECISVYNKV